MAMRIGRYARWARWMVFAGLGFASVAHAGELVGNAVIVELTSTHNGADFSVRTVNGTGPCATGNWIVFPEAQARSAATQKQAFALLTVAQLTGKKVRIHNFADDDCGRAQFGSLSD